MHDSMGENNNLSGRIGSKKLLTNWDAYRSVSKTMAVDID